ncbi:hypothetical protein [Allorhizocola rhizosphaerae]|uniref:hypothetical protein n=1 Tax=Allorhizocola rhizosphaerae TaxID=1872709 RepID=UPI000E3D98FC|nr:hypothetical protein [Allorhizocola rhizosphaerae]
MEPKGNGVKTLGVKLDDALHSQFSLVAALDELSLNDAVIRAVALYVKTKQQEPDFAAKAAAKLEEIEREAAARRGAIQALFGGETPAAAAEPKGKARRGGDTGA